MAETVNERDPRDMRALRLLRDSGQWAKCRVRMQDGRTVKMYGIPSASDPGVYRLANKRFCNCPDFIYRQPQLCAHIRAVRLYVEYVTARRERLEQEERARQQNDREMAAALADGSGGDYGLVDAF